MNFKLFHDPTSYPNRACHFLHRLQDIFSHFELYLELEEDGVLEARRGRAHWMVEEL